MTALLTAIAILAIFLGAIEGRSAPAGYTLHEQRHTQLSSSWVKREIAQTDKHVLIPIRFGLTQSNLDKGSDLLLDISHPDSPNYSKHLSKAEIADLFAPTQDRINAVTQWLRDSLPEKSVKLSQSRQWLHINATITNLQSLLHTEYYEYEHLTTGKVVIRCDNYYIPSHISEHLDFVTPGVVTLETKRPDNITQRSLKRSSPPRNRPFPRSLESGQSSNDMSQCGFLITPACIRAMYNITDKINKANPQNSIGLFEFGEFYNQTDLDDFFYTSAAEIPQGTSPQFAAIDGAPSPSEFQYTTSEADLDLQAAFPLVYPDKVIIYQSGDSYYTGDGVGNYGFLNTFLDAIDGSYCNYSAFGETGDDKGVDPPYPDTHPGGYNHPEQCGAFTPSHVISISYSSDVDDLPLNYQRRQCNEWMKLGLSGVSVLTSSGDVGVAPRKVICERNNTLFAVQTPADCPWITAVGSTVLPLRASVGKTPEVAADLFGSGGGFSNIFPPPVYQQSTVESYFRSSPPPYPYYNITLNATHTHGNYNRGGRGIPDVSAVGQNIAVVEDGASVLEAGTSASAPIFAGIIARINSFRLAAGKKPVGFINPTLYQHPDVFNDIVSGSNPGCGTDGFSAVKGWDPVTGLGTPNYGKMKELFMSLK